MKKRTIISVILLFASLLLLVAGCSDKSGKPASGGNEKVTLEFWYGWTGPEGEAMEKLIKKFNDSQERIFVKGLSQSDYQKQLTAITGGNPPDIASQFGNSVVPWGTKGAMIQLDEYISKSNMNMDDFIPAALDTVQYEGKTYAIPLAMHVLMLFYNKDILTETGLDGPPETMSELKDYINKLSIVNKDGRLDRLGLWPGVDPYTITYSYGGKYWDNEKKEITPDNPGFISALQFSKDIWDEYGSENLDRFASGLGQGLTAQDPFFTGKYAMALNGEWLPTFIDRYAPDLNYGIAPVPYEDGHPEYANPGSADTSVLYIPKGAKHPEESWEFLSWFTAKEQMVEFTAALGNLPTLKSALDDPAYDNIPGFKEFLDYLNTSNNIHSFPALPFMNEYRDKISKEYDAILRGKTSIEDAVDSIKSEIEPLVNKEE